MPKVIHDCPFVAQRSFALIASGVLPVEGNKTSARLLIHIDCDEEYSVRCPDRWGLDFHPRPSFFPCLFLARDNCSQRFIISFRGAHGAAIKGLEYASFTVGTRSVYYSLIGAMSDAGLSIGTHSYLFLENNRLRTRMELFPRTSPVTRRRLGYAGLLALVKWRCIAPSHSYSFSGTATYHHRASVVAEWPKELSMGQSKPIMKVPLHHKWLWIVPSAQAGRRYKKNLSNVSRSGAVK